MYIKSAFLSISYKSKNALSSEIDTIVDVLNKAGFNTLVFAREFSFPPTQEKEMMQKALAEIKKCNIFIAEASTKAIGVGIEVGYAYALGKKIIYLRKKQAEYSTTAGGIADKQIIYSNNDELKTKLEKALSKLRF